MKNTNKKLIKTMFILLLMIGAFFLFDSLYTQYSYSKTTWLATHTYIRYSILLSVILQGVMLFIKHPKRQISGRILFRANISIVYYTLFIPSTSLMLPRAYGIGIITIIWLMLITYKRQKQRIATVVLTIIIMIHLIIMLPGYEQSIHIDDFKQQQQNTLYRTKQSTIDNQIVSIFDSENNTKTSLGVRQANKEYTRNTTGKNIISFASPEQNQQDHVLLTTRNGTIIQLETQSSISIETDQQNIIQLEQGNIYIDDIHTDHQQEILLPSGKRKATPPFYIQQENNQTYVRFSNQTAIFTDNQGNGYSLTPGTYQLPNTTYADLTIQTDKIEQQKRNYTKTRNQRRNSQTTDRNKNQISHKLIYYKLWLMQHIDKSYQQQLAERNKIGCMLYDHQCDTVPERKKLKQKRPTPNN